MLNELKQNNKKQKAAPFGRLRSQTQYFFSLSLRVRLILAVLLTMLPLLVLVWQGVQREFKRESLAPEQEVQRNCWVWN